MAVALLFFVVAPATAQVQVETFNATATFQIDIPGAIVGPDIDFTGTLTITSLDFTPGSVTFQGQPVDFDGTEANWLSNTYSGALTIPAMPGASVPAAGPATTTGPAGNMNGNMNKNSLDLGPAFSDSNFDLQLPSSFDSDDHTMWSSPVIPELNGAPVSIVTVCDIVNVIPNFTINGAVAVVDVSITGEIVAFEPVPAELTTWGRVKALFE
jgi:hypothetical protein